MSHPMINMLQRILPSGLGLKHTQLEKQQQLRKRVSYYNANSIYLENIYNKIATDLAMMRFKHIKVTRNPDGVDLTEWKEFSPLAQVFTMSPNPYDTPTVFWANITRKMLEDGVAVVVPTYVRGNLSELVLADSAYTLENGKITFNIENETKTMDTAHVLIFENPKQNISAKLHQITALIDENLQALSYKLSEENAELKGLLLFPTKTMDEAMKKQAQQRVDNIMESAKRGKIGYLQQGEDFKELNNTYTTASDEELEFLKMQLYQAFGMNEKLFTCDYSENQYRAYFQSVIKVYMRTISEEINRKLFSQTARTQGQKMIAYMDIFDISSLKDLTEFSFKARYSGLFNSNELRDMYGYPAYEGGEVFESNTNAVRLQGSTDGKGGE